MNNKLQEFPWQEIVGFALGKLRLDPQIFWKMTPQELILLLNKNNFSMTLNDLSALKKQFPDKL